MKHRISTTFKLLKPAFCLLLLVLLAPAGSAQFPGFGGFGGNNQGGTESGDALGDATIQYDPDTDSIVVIADDATKEYIRTIINSLDKPVPQVLIKVLFLEVTHTEGSDIGVETILRFDGTGGDQDTAGSNFGIATDILNGLNGGIVQIIEDDFTINANAFKNASKFEVLSRPSILARNNESAIIVVGEEIPFITNSVVTDSGQINNTVDYRDVGIILEVVPHITADRMVEMEVYPEISTLTGEVIQISENFDARVIATRSAETRVVVSDGRTVVIGGLMEDSYTENVKKVPILGDIPLLGMLFSRTTKDKVKTELLIFLTPYVIDTPEALTARSIAERDLTEISPNVFDEGQRRKYIDNLGDQPESEVD